MDYKYIILNDNYELNVWLDFVLKDVKRRVKFSAFRLIMRRLHLKVSRTTFQEIETVYKELNRISDIDLKHLKMIIEHRENVGISLEFKTFFEKMTNYFGYLFVGLIPVILGYKSIENIVISWLNSKTLKSSMGIIVWLFILYLYYVIFKDFLMHGSKKREVRNYLLVMINDILSNRKE
ncbi:hypothetical protein ACR3IL_05460 [Streptococcus iniae]|uniref:hypothetical protein n=1 Tax=Streptococcus iniae TaxID=1346 RepID=UPI000AECB8BF|nr:hypothetical protein [Streptococcus iniae]